MYRMRYISVNGTGHDAPLLNRRHTRHRAQEEDLLVPVHAEAVQARVVRVAVVALDSKSDGVDPFPERRRRERLDRRRVRRRRVTKRAELDQRAVTTPADDLHLLRRRRAVRVPCWIT